MNKTSKTGHPINSVLALIKWPLAILMVLLLVPAFTTLLAFCSSYLDGYYIFHFLFPMFGFFIVFFMMSNLQNSFLAIAEHELTHALFAILTFHKIVGMEIEQDRGGHVQLSGSGNWLITLAPYFFPTFAVVVLLVGWVYSVFNHQWPTYLLPAYGLMVGYHICAVITQIHPKQTDFKQAGRLFTLMFLPGANMVVFGLLFAIAFQKWEGIPLYFRALFLKTREFLEQITG